MVGSPLQQLRKFAVIMTTAFALTIGSALPANAALLFQDDNFGTVNSDNLVIDNNNTNTGDIILKFGTTLAKTLLYSQANARFEFNAGVDLGNFQLSTVRLENVSAMPGGAGGLGAGGIGRIVELTATDVIAPGCTTPSCSPGTYTWNGTIWKELASLISNTAKIVTVGTTGRDYTTISAAATTLNALSGGEIWLDAGSYSITGSIDLENIKVVGPDNATTTLVLTGAGKFLVRNTEFKNVTINPDSSLTSASALDVKFNAASSSAVHFNKVNFNVASGEIVLDTTSGSTPLAVVDFTDSNQAGTAGNILNLKSGSSLSLSSTFTVNGKSGNSGLKLQDWDVTVINEGNVITSGTITSVADRVIEVAPNMNVQKAVDSLGASGGRIRLLAGTHDVTTSLVITNDKVIIEGVGHSSILRAVTGSWTGGTTNNDSVIQVGLANGTAPRSNVILNNFTLQVGPNIHGIEVNGGTENKVSNMVVQSIGAKSSSRVGIIFTDGSGAAGSKFTAQGNVVNSDNSTDRWVDGIHFDGNADISGQIFGYGNGITDSVINQNIVTESKESAYAFSQLSSSAISKNIARTSAFTASASVMFFNDVQDVTVLSNTLEGANAVSVIGINLFDNVDASTFVSNILRGGPTNFATGINIASSNSSQNVLVENQYDSATVVISDTGTDTRLDVGHHRGIVAPTVNDDITKGYQIGATWVNTVTQKTYVCVASTAGAAIWNENASTSVPTDPAFTLNLSDDFMGGTSNSGQMGELGWSFTTGTYSVVAGEFNHPGITSWSTGATLSRIRLGGDGSETTSTFDPMNNFTSFYIVRPSGGNVSNTMKRLGFLNEANVDPPSSGIYFEYDTGNADTTWQCVTRAAGTQTKTNSTVSLASGTWYKLSMVRNASNIEFYINGTLRCTNTTNIPTVIVRPVMQQQDRGGGGGSTGNNLDIDLFYLNFSSLTR